MGEPRAPAPVAPCRGEQEKIHDGWYFTGDFGYIDDDRHLVVIDRMEDLKELKGGRKFSPKFAEIRLRFCTYIKDALVIGGEDKDYVTIINIDIENVGRWAETKRIPYTTLPTSLKNRK